MSSKKRLVEISEEEYEKLERKKAKKTNKKIVQKIKERNQKLQTQLKGTSIHHALERGICVNDDDHIIVGGYDDEHDANLLWSVDYIDLVDDKVLDCDKEHEDLITYKLELDYAEPIFRGVPVTPEIQEIVDEISGDIQKLNAKKLHIVNRINYELKEAIWKAANEFITTKK